MESYKNKNPHEDLHGDFSKVVKVPRHQQMLQLRVKSVR